MTYSDIYKKFLIQYDKADIISSYPSLTKVEIAEMLDKAYLVLISQKFTGTNTRGIPFEGDSKAIEDIRPIIETVNVECELKEYFNIKNSIVSILPTELLYYITASIKLYESQENPSYVNLISHQSALNFIQTDSNIPWIKIPVSYIEGNKLIILYDPYKKDDISANDLTITYIRKPIKFSDTLESNKWNETNFELSDSMADELVSLSVIFSLENIESQRLQSKEQLKSIEQ